MLVALIGRRVRLRRATLVAATFVAVALIAAACGAGTSSPGVAGSGASSTTTASTPASSSGSSAYEKAVSYAKCMRSHGIGDMPDPDNGGNFDLKALHPGPQSDLNPGNPHYDLANQACQHLLPNGGQLTPAEQQQNQAEALAWAHCMRAHGVSNFPDPGSNGRLSVGSIRSAGIDFANPLVQRATKACQQYQPNSLHLPSAAGGA